MIRRVAAGLALLCLALPVLSEETPPRPKIGLALGGGGARGMAHIGVIRGLEALHIPIDFIAGTSMGAVVGGLYACGYTPDEMEKLIKSIHWETLFQDAPDRPEQSFRRKEDDFDHLLPIEFGVGWKKGLVLPPGLIAGSKLGFVLQSATLPCSSVGTFDELRIPFRAVATNVQTGDPVILSQGNLARVIRASMAIPAIFSPVEIGDLLLIDGGESQNLPVQTVRAMGADIVIAVNVGESGQASASKPSTASAMIARLIDLPLQQNTAASARLADLVITPDLRGYTSADFVSGPEMIPLGEKAVVADSSRLTAWAEPEAAYDAWKNRHDATLPPVPYIDAVEIDPAPGIDARRIDRLVQTKPGRPLDTVVLGQDLKRIYALGVFEIVSYAIVREGDRHILRITATPKPWGPTYLRLGLALGTDFAETTTFGVVGLLDATELNRLGGDWKTTFTVGSPLEIRTRFYQPLEYSGRLFASPYAAWRQQPVEVFDGDDAVGTYRVEGGVLGFDLGYDFGTWGELRVGALRGFGKGRRRVGNPTFPNIDWDNGALTATLVVDQLDNVNLPRSGYFGDVQLRLERTGLGSSFSYDKLQAGALGVRTIGRWSGVATIEGGDNLGTTIAFYDEFQLGGLFRLSGRPQGQLTGQTYALTSLLLYYRMTSTPGAIVKNIYVGTSVEAGNAWPDRASVSFSGLKTGGSFYVVADSILGPFFVGYGRSGSNSSFYLTLNTSF
jgi:NTE family protein